MNGYSNFITKLARDLIGFLQSRPDVDLEAIDHLTTLPTYDLGTARTNKKIYNRSGCRIFVTTLTGTAYIRTRPTGEKYSLFKGSLSFPFKELYLTNTAQAGKTLTLIIGLQSFVDLDPTPTGDGDGGYEEVYLKDVAGDVINPVTSENIVALKEALMNAGTPKDLKDVYDQLYEMRGAASPKHLRDVWQMIYNIYLSHLIPIRFPMMYSVEMTNADTEYSLTVQANARAFKISSRDGTPFRYSHYSGKVAASIEPYWLVRPNEVFELHITKMSYDKNTIYVACSEAGKIVQAAAGA